MTVAGIYDEPADRRFGVVPLAWEGLDLVPYQWAIEFPPLTAFIERFPEHWRRNDALEAWVGPPSGAGVFWVRYDPKEEK